MRGTMLIGLAVVLLIIGILAVKNMGADKPGAVQESQTEEYMEKAKTAAADAAKRLKDIKKQMSAVD
jgi:Na+-transporting methylmalonyl-CoA/oxaloacetate decarboxylase gamma subunit